MSIDDDGADPELLAIGLVLTEMVANHIGLIVNETPFHYALVLYLPGNDGVVCCAGSEPRTASIKVLKHAVKKLTAKQQRIDNETQ